MDIQDVCKLENKYNIKICLFEIIENKVVRAHIPKTKINGKIATLVTNLLNFDTHYVLIKDLSRLIASQITKNRHKILLGQSCGGQINEQEKFEKHNKKENCEDPDFIIPKQGFKIEFENMTKQMKVPCYTIAYFDS